MRRRLYFLLPDVVTARRTFDRLLLARIEDRHVHVMAREGTDLGDLPQADVWQKSDLMHGMEQGLAIGGLTGAAAGAFLVYFAPAGLEVGLGAVLGLALLGAVFGAWVSGLIGFDVPNTQLKQFQGIIEKGKVLMMVDVPKSRMDEITHLVEDNTPDAKASGSDPMMPVFP